MTALREAAQQALEAIEGSGCKADLMAAADALRAALAEQEDDLTAAWMAGAAEERKRAPQPLTIERLQKALMGSRVVPPEAVEDPDNYDDGVMLSRIEALFRRLV